MTIPRLGMGCWAIGGHFWFGDQPLGWGDVDDAESIAAVRRAVELGIRCFDTADVYGCGHSEKVLAEALSPFSETILVSTKIGNRFDESSRQMSGTVDDAAGVRGAVDASLRRLRRDRLDLVFFHVNEHPLDASEVIFDTLQELRREGKVAAFGWSTDDPVRMERFAALDGLTCVQHNMNLFVPASDVPPLLEKCDLFAMARQPLAMGLLSGKFGPGRHDFQSSDIRASGPEWQTYFHGGVPDRQKLDAIEAIRELLTADGRTVAQGALAWIWAKSPRIIPIPGFRTLAQVEDNAGALEKGPLSSAAVEEIDRLVSA